MKTTMMMMMMKTTMMMMILVMILVMMTMAKEIMSTEVKFRSLDSASMGLIEFCDSIAVVIVIVAVVVVVVAGGIFLHSRLQQL